MPQKPEQKKIEEKRTWIFQSLTLFLIQCSIYSYKMKLKLTIRILFDK